jgi:hypothetical protein
MGNLTPWSLQARRVGTEIHAAALTSQRYITGNGEPELPRTQGAERVWREDWADREEAPAEPQENWTDS